jgi:glutamate dehydrogenase (NADP+)
MIKYASGGKESFKGKRVAVSGSGNVAQYAALKAIELGAIVVSLSDSKGALIATGEEGVSPKQVETVAALKVKRQALSEIAHTDEFKGAFKYIDGARPWTHVGKIDIALPCATQNEVSGDEAKALIEAGAKFVAEGSNMGCSQDAIDVFETDRKSKKGEAIWYAPGKLVHSPHTILMSNYLQQAKQPTPAASPFPVSKWPKTANVSRGQAKKWIIN